METKKLINWGELSRTLSGSRFTLRANKVPKIHKQLIDELLISIEYILKKHGKYEK